MAVHATYVRMSQLHPRVLYKILNLETRESSTGIILKATIITSSDLLLWCHLPKSYTQRLSPEETMLIQSHITLNRNPYLLYYGTINNIHIAKIVPNTPMYVHLWEQALPEPQN